MSENVDVVVIGMGPGGEVVAGELAKANRRVVVIERELIGGECAYYACIPSKVVLRAPALGQEVDHAAGITDARLSWEKTRTYRDQMARHWDDSTQVDSYEGQGVTVVKGEGRIVKPGVVAVGAVSLWRTILSLRRAPRHTFLLWMGLILCLCGQPVNCIPRRTCLIRRSLWAGALSQWKQLHSLPDSA